MIPPFVTNLALEGLPHGFFGREGGVSIGDNHSLNVSQTNGDDADAVATNRARVVEALGLAGRDLVTLKQTHSPDVVVVDDLDFSRPPADAIVTRRNDLVLGILTADCTPILLADPVAGVIGAAHAGWKGAVDGVVHNTVAAMIGLGASLANMVAVIGPTISAQNYEVGPDFVTALLDKHPEAERHITTPPGGREHFDLPGFVARALAEAGVGRVEDLAICTYGHPEAYFSHRYATHRGTGAGRQIAVIALP